MAHNEPDSLMAIHVVRRIGVRVCRGLDGVDKWPNLTRALLEEGYSQDDIIKIYGGNTLRLMTEVEQVAAAFKTSK